MVFVAPGNVINMGSSYTPQGWLDLPLTKYLIHGYFDITPTPAAVFDIIVASPDKGVAPKRSLTIPNGAYLFSSGIKVPATALNGQPINVTGTGTDALLIGGSAIAAGTPRIALAGGVLSAGENQVTALAPAALGAEANYKAYVANALTAVGYPVRCYAYVLYGVVAPYPNIEDVEFEEAPTYTY